MHLLSAREIRTVASNVLREEQPVLSVTYWASVVVSILAAIVALFVLFSI